MRAGDIRVGDVYCDVIGFTPEAPVYRVEEIVDVVPSRRVKVRVRYHDGGDGLRVFGPQQEVPLVTTADSTGPTANQWTRP